MVLLCEESVHVRRILNLLDIEVCLASCTVSARAGKLVTLARLGRGTHKQPRVHMKGEL